MSGIILIAFMAVLSTAYITASLNTQRAQNYHSTVVTELEAADFSAEVAGELQTAAVENGYADLNIQNLTGVNGRKYAKVTLVYDYTIPVLNLFLEHRIVGYAR